MRLKSIFIVVSSLVSLLFFCNFVQAATNVTRTDVVTFKPALPAAGKTVSGNCWTSSIAVNRADAWRCMVGNAIHDPCFTTTDANKMVCDADPITRKAGFILTLTKPLPASNVKAAMSRPWVIQLADNTICKPFTGTMPITDKGGIGFYCYTANVKPNPAAKCHTGLIVDSIKKGNVWHATKVVYCSSPKSQTGLAVQKSEETAIKNVWQ